MNQSVRRVMVIDDSKTIRTTTENILKELGHQVQCCSDGLNGISHILTFKPDVLFIDVEMPRMNGLQTARLIRRNPQFKDAIIIMLSSKDGMFDQAMGMAAGADDYVAKPPIREAIEAVLAKHQGASK